MTAPASASGGILLALAGAAAYGFNITFARIAAFEGVQGPLMVFYRVVIMLALAVGMAVVLRASLSIPADKRGQYIQEGVGHYGVFSGSKFQNEIYPVIRDFIGKSEDEAVQGYPRTPAKGARLNS